MEKGYGFNARYAKSALAYFTTKAGRLGAGSAWAWCISSNDLKE
jgi:hypothetical protein